MALFFEGQFALLVVVFVLSTTSVFTALECQSVERLYFCYMVLSMFVVGPRVAVKDQICGERLTFPLFLGMMIF